MKVTLLIPTRNEEGAIGKTLAEVPKKYIDQIIVVDGHSKDNTVNEVKANLRPGKDKLLIQKGLGYGSAFIQGLEKATGDIIIMMDADGSHDPRDIPKLIAKIKEGYDYVMATRYLKGAGSDDNNLWRDLGNRFFTQLTNIVHGTRVTDSLYLYTAMRKKDLDKMHFKSNHYEFCTEILVKAHKMGLKFAEVPSFERARESGESKVNSFKDGVKITKMILRKYD
jgi:glycosyltransferase involved in cell wall biosynthesis